MNSQQVILIIITCLATAAVASAQCSPKDYIDAHNTIRAEVGVGPMIWNETLAAYAQAYSEKRAPDCAIEHSQGPYGENLASGSWDMSAKDAVDMWYDEKKLFDAVADKRINENDMSYLHYTQIVWNTTTCVGCGKVTCANGWTFITCSYDPPGNFIGECPF
ncbi:basic form of pathogenesis-related protein 1-like [Andrographis paniculata]|uniref:basic form of pathogenesis-related protein 1-like n=1 Tax=Andrographis paniculata TaxID=175694 RepID=UPI0021E993D7|nr:basic form of pathogenesis-related protein 1-like [Andrographis paniculata]